MKIAASIAATLFWALPQAAHAQVDGCAIKLCMAGNWKNIPFCRPLVEKALKNIAKGRGWPACQGSNGGDSSEAAWAPGNCPQQYTYTYIVGDGVVMYGCTMKYVMRFNVNDKPWSNVWVDQDDNTSTEYFPQALSMLPPEQIDPRFLDDYTRWAAIQPPPASPTGPEGSGGGS